MCCCWKMSKWNNNTEGSTRTFENNFETDLRSLTTCKFILFCHVCSIFWEIFIGIFVLVVWDFVLNLLYCVLSSYSKNVNLVPSLFLLFLSTESQNIRQRALFELVKRPIIKKFIISYHVLNNKLTVFKR